MGINFKESGDAIVAEKDGNGNWVLYNQDLYSANDPFLKIDGETGETTWMSPPSGGGDVSNPMTEDLDAGGYSIGDALLQDADLESTTLLSRFSGSNAFYGTQEPNARYIEAVDTTFFTFRGPDADPYASAYNHSNKKWSPVTQIGDNPLEVDDNHGPPTIAVDSNGIIYVVYGAHYSNFQIAKSTNPYDITEWTDLGEISNPPIGTYPSIVCDSSDNLWITYRAGSEANDDIYPSDRYGTLIKSTDGGESWIDEGPIIDTTDHPEDDTRVYVNGLYLKGGHLHITWVLQAGGSRQNIYHAYYNPSDGNMYDLAGNSYGSTIDWSEHSDGVVQVVDYDNIPTAHAIPYNGGWAIGFQEDTDDNTVWDKRVAIYSGGSWTDERVGSLTTNIFGHYSSIRVNGQDNLEMHAIVGADNVFPEVTDKKAGDYVIAEWVNGNWEVEYIIKSSRDFAVAKTITVRNGTDKFSALCSELEQPTGDPSTHYEDFKSRLIGYGAFVRKGYDKYGPPNLARRLPTKLLENVTWSLDLLNFSEQAMLQFMLTSTKYFIMQNEFGGLGLTNSNENQDGKLLVNPDGTVTSSDGGFVPPTNDLTSIAGNRDGEIQVHDGTASKAAGYYRWSNSTSSWVKVNRSNLGDAETQYISSGTLTFNGNPFILVNGENDTADTLDSMGGGSEGQRVVLWAYADNVTITHVAGGAGQFVLTSDTDVTVESGEAIEFLMGSGGYWREVGNYEFNDYDDSDAIGAIESQEIDNRDYEMLTDDIYIDDQGEWVHAHMDDDDAHHSKTTSSEIDHDSTGGGTDSNAHHSKTTEASDLTDVSPDGGAVKAYVSDTWDLANNTFEKIPADTEVYDYLGEWDESNYEFEANMDGIYLVGASFQLTDPGDGTRMIIRFYVNGTEKASLYQHAGVDDYLRPLGSTQLSLSSGDVVTIKAFQDSGGNVYPSTGEPNSFVTFKKIG